MVSPDVLELALLCQDSYKPDPDTDAPLAAKYQQIGGLGIVCFIIPRATYTLVVIRGSDDIPGWFNNLRAYWTTHPWGMVHAGFLEDWKSIRTQVALATRDQEIHLVGHSLGGAVAVLAATELPNVKQIVTFGAPMIGDKEFVTRYDLEFGHETIRYVNQLDPVPWTPSWFKGYNQVCYPLWFDGKEWETEISLIAAFQIFFRIVRETLKAIGDGPWWKKVWNNVLRASKTILEDHFIDAYIEALKKFQRNTLL